MKLKPVRKFNRGKRQVNDSSCTLYSKENYKMKRKSYSICFLRQNHFDFEVIFTMAK